MDEEEYLQAFQAGIPGANLRPADFEYRREQNIERMMRENYEISVLGRGEELQYRADGKALTADISWIDGLRLYKRSLVRWDDGTPLTKTEYGLALERICEYLSCDVEGGPILED
jgi:hypothetical protein